MCEMMSKGSKEALTVLIVAHVTHVKFILVIHYHSRNAIFGKELESCN